MSGDAVDLNIRQCGDFLENIQRARFRRSHPSHSGIDHKIDRDRLTVRSAIECLRFFQGRNRGDESALGDCRSFLRNGRTENDNWMRQRFPKSARFFQVRDAEQLRVVREHFRNADHAMPISVRLHDGEKLGRSGSLTHNLRVVA